MKCSYICNAISLCSRAVVLNLWVMSQIWVIGFFCLVMSQFQKYLFIYIYIYIIFYIIHLRLKFNITKIKFVIGSWYIFKLIIIKKRLMMKKVWEPLL